MEKKKSIFIILIRIISIILPLVLAFVFINQPTPWPCILCFAIVVLSAGIQVGLFVKKHKAPEPKIIETRIVGTSQKTDKTSAAVRTIVGNEVLGVPGAIYGAATAKSQDMVTFLILFDDGSKKTETVKQGSILYEAYMKYLKS